MLLAASRVFLLLHKIQVVRADAYNKSIASRGSALDDAEVTKVKEVKCAEGYDRFGHVSRLRVRLRVRSCVKCVQS